MRCEKWIFRVSLALNVLVVLPVTLFVCFILFYICWAPFARQLIPFKATGWQLEAGTHTGESLSLNLYKTRGRGPEGERFYLHIAGGDDAPISRWFTLDFSSEELGVIVFCPPVERHRSPRLVNWNPGIDVTNPKLEDGDWWLSYTGDKVIFSNKTYFVSATQKNSGRPPVEVHRSTMDGLIVHRPLPQRHELTGYNLTLFDPSFEEGGWAVFSDTPFWDSPEPRGNSSSHCLVFTNTNDVRTAVSRTIYVRKEDPVEFYAERVETAQLNRQYMGEATKKLYAERFRAGLMRKYNELQLSVGAFDP